MRQEIDIHGSALAGSSVEVHDDYGRVVAEAKANASGNWMVHGVALAPGEHVLRAKATSPGGKVEHSPAICIDDDDTAPGIEVVDDHAHRARVIYEKMVLAVVDGAEIDDDVAEDIVQAAGVSWSEFQFDLYEQVEVSRVFERDLRE